MKLLAAVAAVESALFLFAYNPKEQAAGILQVRPCVVEDVNGICARNNPNRRYNLSDRWDREKSQEIFAIYTSHWLRIHPAPAGMSEAEARARIWNGGPRGHYKNQTKKYWEKVCAHKKSE